MSREEESEFCTVPEAARTLGVSQATIWRWIEARRLHAYRVGPRRIRIKKQDVRTMIRPVHERTGDENPEVQDLWGGYDVPRMREALKQSAGALAGIDRLASLSDLHAARKQSSQGRPD